MLSLQFSLSKKHCTGSKHASEEKQNGIITKSSLSGHTYTGSQHVLKRDSVWYNPSTLSDHLYTFFQCIHQHSFTTSFLEDVDEFIVNNTFSIPKQHTSSLKHRSQQLGKEKCGIISASLYY